MFPPLLFYSQFADFVAVCHTIPLDRYHALLLNCCRGQGSVFCICHVRVCLTFIFSLRQAVTSCLFYQAALSHPLLQLHSAQQPFSSLSYPLCFFPSKTFHISHSLKLIFIISLVPDKTQVAAYRN